MFQLINGYLLSAWLAGFISVSFSPFGNRIIKVFSVSIKLQKGDEKEGYTIEDYMYTFDTKLLCTGNSM